MILFEDKKTEIEKQKKNLEIQEPPAPEILTAVPGEEPEVHIDKPEDKTGENSTRDTKPTAAEESEFETSEEKYSSLESYLNEWGSMHVEKDACEHCRADAMQIPKEALISFDRTQNKREKVQTKDMCQLKTVLMIMIGNLEKNTHNKKRSEYYHKGFGHKTLSNTTGIRTTCRCYWKAKDGTRFTTSDLDTYIQERLGFSDVLD